MHVRRDVLRHVFERVVRAALEGDTMLSGNKVKYDVRVQLGSKGLLVLSAAGLASAFPPEEAEAFFSSVK